MVDCWLIVDIAPMANPVSVTYSYFCLFGFLYRFFGVVVIASALIYTMSYNSLCGNVDILCLF